MYNRYKICLLFDWRKGQLEKAGLYVRLSDEDEDKLNKEDLSRSIINQKALLKEYAKEHGFEIYKIYCDDDYSGLYDDRPGFQELLADAEAGKFKVIIAKSQSRFSRNMEHIEKYLHNEFINQGIRFIGVVDGVDTAVKSNKKSRQIYMLTNEWYCEDLSENIHAVFDTKMKKGDFIGSFAPYGYKKDPANKNHLIIDAEAAKVVRRIFDMFLNGYTASLICRILTEEKIPTPAVYKKQQGLTYKYKQKYNYCEEYGLWAETTVRRILQNKSYLGHMVQGKSRKINYKSKKIRAMPTDEWIIVKNMHEPIISESDFEEVQKRFLVRVRGKRESGMPELLSGKLKCAQCGNPLVCSGKNPAKTRTYLRCQLAKKSKGDHCTRHKVVMQEIEEAVFEKIRGLIKHVMQNENDVQEISEIFQMSDIQNSEKQQLEKKSVELDKKIEESKEILKNLYVDKVNGVISSEFYMEMSRDYEKIITDASKEKDEVVKRWKLILEDETRLKDYCQMVREYCNIKILTREIVNKFIDYIELSEDENEEQKELIIHWNV